LIRNLNYRGKTMRHMHVCITLGYFLLTAPIAKGQTQKPGLYDMTITTTTVFPSRKASPSGKLHPPRNIQACLTQDMVDKYGAIVPQYLANTCQLTNVVKKTGGMTADMVCSGRMNGKGTLQIDWADSEHAKGLLHFSGTMRPGDDEIKIEWSAVTTSAYKGPDCGELKPTAPSPPPQAPSAPPQ
jgi:hypothetical protein